MSSAPPLAGMRLVEMEALGPAPFGVMLLADLGAEERLAAVVSDESEADGVRMAAWLPTDRCRPLLVVLLVFLWNVRTSLITLTAIPL
jgi:alpha-methylacyl-CoA racemase